MIFHVVKVKRNVEKEINFYVGILVDRRSLPSIGHFDISIRFAWRKRRVTADGFLVTRHYRYTRAIYHEARSKLGSRVHGSLTRPVVEIPRRPVTRQCPSAALRTLSNPGAESIQQQTPAFLSRLEHADAWKG